jgi:hypothetical protein
MITAIPNPAASIFPLPLTNSESISLHWVHPKWRVNASSKGFFTHSDESMICFPEVSKTGISGAFCSKLR